MMRLTSVTCGSVSLAVSPGGRSRTCSGRVCFGGFISFSFHGGKRIPVGQAPFVGWLEQGLGQGWHLAAKPLLFGGMERAKSWVWGERGSQGWRSPQQRH